MTDDTKRLRELIAARGDCAGPVTTFPPDNGHASPLVGILCENWTGVIEWLAACERDVPSLLDDNDMLRRACAKWQEIFTGFPHDAQQALRDLNARVAALVMAYDGSQAQLTAAKDDNDRLRAEVSCGGRGCGTDEGKVCLRCCRVMLSNYAANHGARCDAEQERLLFKLESSLDTSEAIDRELTACKQQLSTLTAERDTAIAAKDEACDIAVRRGAAIDYLERKIDGYETTFDVADEIEHGLVDFKGRAKIKNAERLPSTTLRIAALQAIGTTKKGGG